MFRIENRHQDEGWESSGESYPEYQQSFLRAEEMSRQAIHYGMVRVVEDGVGVVVTFMAGGGEIPVMVQAPSAAPQDPLDDIGPQKGGSALGNLLRRLADHLDGKGDRP